MNSFAIDIASCPVGLDAKFRAVLMNPELIKPPPRLLFTVSGIGRLGGAEMGILGYIMSISSHKHKPAITNNTTTTSPFEHIFPSPVSPTHKLRNPRND